MTIYIEAFLIQNILINFCLLKLVNLTTKSNTSFFKLILSSIVGASFSVISAIFLINIVVINFLKLTCAIIMILLAFKQQFKQFIFNLILLFLYTFAFGGAITTLSSNVYLTSFGAVVSSKYSLELITLIIICITCIFEQVPKHLKHKLKINNYIYKTTLYLHNEKLTINAYLDTGNLLEHDGNPIIILDFNSYLKLTKNNIIQYFNQKACIKTNTVNGQNTLKLFKVDKLKIKNNNKNIVLQNQLVAVTTKCFNSTNYQALLSPLLF